jgi:hypothetical protein
MVCLWNLPPRSIGTAVTCDELVRKAFPDKHKIAGVSKRKDEGCPHSLTFVNRAIEQLDLGFPI